MPFLSNQDYLTQQEEDEKKRQQRLGGQAVPGAGVTESKEPVVPVAEQAPAAPTGGNLFAQMRAANLGNVRLAQQIAAGQEARGKTFQDFLAEKQAGLAKATKAGTTEAAPQVVGRVLGAPERAGAADLAAFNRQITAQYRGPSGFEEFAGPEAEARQRELLAEGDTSDPAVLASLIGGRGAGKQRLNIGLLSTGENRELLDREYEELTAGLEEGLGEARERGEELAETGERRTRAAREAAERGLETAQMRQERNERALQRRAANTRAVIQRRTRYALKTGRAPLALLKTLGISNRQWNLLQKDIADIRRGRTAEPRQNIFTGMSRSQIYNHFRNVNRENEETARRRTNEVIASGRHRLAPARRIPGGTVDPRELYRPATGRITAEQAMTPAQGARAQALERLAGFEVDPYQEYGDVETGRFDPNRLARVRHRARVART